LTDGASRDATAEAKWAVSGSHGDETTGEFLASLDGGLFKGVAAPGSAEIVARLDNRRATADVVVLAPGTYTLRGVVREEGSPTRVIPDAHVEARLSDRSVLEADGGTYLFYGVAGEVRLRVSGEGYQTVTRTFVVSDHMGYDVWLPLLKPRLQISGTYTMTIRVEDHCGVGLGEGLLPESAARVRAYRADIQQTGPHLEVRLDAPALREQYRKVPFGGTVAPEAVTFNFGWIEFPYLVEDLPEFGVLVIDGDAAATGDSNRLSGTFSGTFRVFDEVRNTGDLFKPAVAWCYSTSHRFELSR
jgi:hypothetical protein